MARNGPPSQSQRGARLAPLWRRFAAFAVDVFTAGVIGAPPTAFLALLIPDLSDAAFDLISRIMGFVVFTLYSILITISRGQTLGKYLFDVRVVTAATLDEPSEPQIVTRSVVLGLALAFCVVVLPLLQVPPLIVGATLAAFLAPMLLRPDRRTLHDLVAGTAVVLAPKGEEPRSSEGPRR